jgi:suppressor of G2 allele of SKP1
MTHRARALQAVAGGASIVDAGAAPPREYPSSSRKKGATDWDKLESDVKAAEKDEKLDGEAGLQKFFKGLYGNLDEDARRAMNKSFQARAPRRCRAAAL